MSKYVYAGLWEYVIIANV